MTNENDNNKKKPNVVTIIVALIIVVTMLFYFFTFQVRITEKAVVTTFGKPTKTIDPTKDSNPGLYWKWPYPFQDVDIFDSRMRIFTGTLEQIFTSDGKSIILQTYTGWKIDNPKTFLVRIGTEWEAKTTLESFIRTHTNIVISKHSFYQIISKNKKVSFLEEIESTVKIAVNNEAKDLGMKVGEFGFRRLVLPESTTKEVSNRMKEERNRLAEKYRSEGAKQADMIRSSADAHKEEQLIIARARAKEIEGEAFAEIEKEYEIFAKEKELAIWIRKLESLKKILKANRSTLLLDPSTAPFDLLKDSRIHLGNSEKNVKTDDNKIPEKNIFEKANPISEKSQNATSDSELDTSNTSEEEKVSKEKNTSEENNYSNTSEKDNTSDNDDTSKDVSDEGNTSSDEEGN